MTMLLFPKETVSVHMDFDDIFKVNMVEWERKVH
jgi:hypothetical protein